MLSRRSDKSERRRNRNSALNHSGSWSVCDRFEYYSLYAQTPLLGRPGFESAMAVWLPTWTKGWPEEPGIHSPARLPETDRSRDPPHPSLARPHRNIDHFRSPCYRENSLRCSSWGRVKREAGENPARSRHCKQRAAGVFRHCSSEWEGEPVRVDLRVRRPASGNCAMLRTRAGRAEFAIPVFPSRCAQLCEMRLGLLGDVDAHTWRR
jgi:hypothetical protein